MPFNTGTIIYIILLIASFVWAIYETYQDSHRKRENIAFLTAFALIGIPFYGYGWTAFFTGIVVLAVVYVLLQWQRPVNSQGKEASYSPYLISSKEHCAAMYADVDHRLLILRSDSDTFYSQSSYGSELTRGHLHPRKLSES